MLDDLQHLILPEAETVAGLTLRPLTLQTYALLEMSENQILTAPEARMQDVLGFLYLHTADLKAVCSTVSAYVNGNKAAILQAALTLPPIPLSNLAAIAQQIRGMIERATAAQPIVDAPNTSTAGN